MAVVTFPIHVGLCRKYGVWVNETQEQAIEELEDYKKLSSVSMKKLVWVLTLKLWPTTPW